MLVLLLLCREDHSITVAAFWEISCRLPGDMVMIRVSGGSYEHLQLGILWRFVSPCRRCRSILESLSIFADKLDTSVEDHLVALTLIFCGSGGVEWHLDQHECQ